MTSPRILDLNAHNSWAEGETYEAQEVPQRPRCRGRCPGVTARVALPVLLALFTILAFPLTAMASQEGIIGAYSFDEGTGEIANDFSGHENNGAVSGAAWSESRDSWGWSLQFDGENDCLVIPDLPKDHLDEGFTLEAWVKPEAKSEVEAHAPQVIFSREGPGFGQFAAGLNLQHAGKFEGIARESPEGLVAAEDPEPTYSNFWRFVSLTFDGEDLRLFQFGDFIAETSVTGSLESGSGDITVGCSNASEDPFRGKIDEVRIYDRALSKGELNEDAETPVQRSMHLLTLGQLAEVAPETLVSPQKTLYVLGVSVGGGHVSKIETLQDEEVVESLSGGELTEQGPEVCSGQECSVTIESMSAFLDDVTSGPHTIEVKAFNDEEEETRLTYEPIVDAQLPKLSLSGGLAESEGIVEGGAETVEILADDGEGAYDSGVSELKVYVDGKLQKAAGSCEAECAATKSLSYEYSEEKWGSGPHELEVVAFDAAGNETSEAIQVNSTPAAVEPSCWAIEPNLEEVEGGASVEEAIESIEATVPAALEPAEDEADEDEFRLSPRFVASNKNAEHVENFMARGSTVGGRVFKEAGAGIFSIGQSACLAPSRATPVQSAPFLDTGSGAVVLANTATDTDTLIRNNGFGTTTVMSFRGPGAPSSLSWRVELQSGQELHELEDGGVAIVAPGGPDQPERDLPSPEPNINDLSYLASVEVGARAWSYELKQAGNEVEGSVEAVVPEALAVDAEGNAVSIPVTLSYGEWPELAVEVPEGTKAIVLRTDAAPTHAATCAKAYEQSPQLYQQGCGSAAFDLGERPYITGMDWAPDGSFVYAAYFNKFLHYDLLPGESRSSPAISLYQVNEDGSEVEQIAVPGFKVLGSPKVSPDGSKLLFNGCSESLAKCGIVATDSDGNNGSLVVALPGPRIDDVAEFMPDGEGIVYEERIVSEPNSEDDQLYRIDLNGANKRALTDIGGTWYSAPVLGRGLVGNSPPAINPETGEIAFVYYQTIYTLEEVAEGASLEEANLRLEYGDQPSFNATGTRMVFSRDSGGRNGSGIFVANPDGSEVEVVAETPQRHEKRGLYPVFSDDGSEVAYIMDGLIYKTPLVGGAQEVAVDGEGNELRTFSAALGAERPALQKEVEAAEAVYPEVFQGAEMSGSYTSGIEKIIEDIESLDGTQREICEDDPSECTKYNLYAVLTERTRAALFTAGHAEVLTSTVANAFQHAMWTTLMVRGSIDTHEQGGEQVVDGLLFALHHERYPLSLDARQDIVNDWVGYWWWAENGYIPAGEEEKPVSMFAVCQGIFEKADSAIFVKGHDPFEYILKHPDYQAKRLVFRKKRAFLDESRNSPLVRPNGRSCLDVWSKVKLSWENLL